MPASFVVYVFRYQTKCNMGWGRADYETFSDHTAANALMKTGRSGLSARMLTINPLVLCS